MLEYGATQSLLIDGCDCLVISGARPGMLQKQSQLFCFQRHLEQWWQPARAQACKVSDGRRNDELTRSMKQLVIWFLRNGDTSRLLKNNIDLLELPIPGLGRALFVSLRWLRAVKMLFL